MLSKTNKRPALIATTAAVLLALAALAQAGDPMGAGSTAVATTNDATAPIQAAAPAVAADVVRVGLMTDTQGPYARIGGMQEVNIAARMAVEDYKAEGGRLDAAFFNSDEGNSPAVSAKLAERLIKENHVTLITGVINSGTAAAVFKVGGANKVMTVGTSSSATTLINESCTPYSEQGMQNAYNLTKGIVPELVKQGKLKWFFVNADYNFGITLRDEAQKLVEAAGGKMVGSASHPFPAADFTEVVAAAKAADADVIAVASAGSDVTGFLKAAREAHLATATKSVVPLALYLQDVNDLGFENAAGLTVYGSFFWTQSPQTEAFAKRFYARTRRMPDQAHAVAYSSIYQYLKAADKVGGVDNDKIMAYLKSHEINDAIFQHAHLRADGSMIHDGYVVRIKSEAQATSPWDYYEKVKAVKGEDVAFPIERSTCPLVRPTTPAAVAK